MTILPEPQSPRRTLKGESIRSLRGTFQKSLSYSESLSSLPTSPVSLPEEGKNSNQEQLVIGQHEENLQNNDDDTTKPIEISTAAPPVVVILPSRRPAHEVRLQFLQNLGIHQKQQPTDSTITDNSTATTFEPWGPSYEGFINDNDDSNETLQENNGRRAVLVHFHPTIRIHPIPSHKVYSNRIKQTIWTGVEELGDNVARNSLEFSYEEWNANNVVDEESGLIWFHESWVHPVHFQHDNNDLTLPPPTQQQQQQQQQSVLSSDEIWRQKCERLGILPAEYYHSLSTVVVPTTTMPSNNDTSTTT